MARAKVPRATACCGGSTARPTAVCTYYGRYPVPHLTLDVHVRGGPGVHHGVTYPAGRRRPDQHLRRCRHHGRRPGHRLDAHPRDDPSRVSVDGREPSLDRGRPLGLRRADRARAGRTALRREDVERRGPRHAARRARPGRSRARQYAHLGPHLLGWRDVRSGGRCPHPRADAQSQRLAGRAARHSERRRKHHPGLGDRAGFRRGRQGYRNHAYSRIFIARCAISPRRSTWLRCGRSWASSATPTAPFSSFPMRRWRTYAKPSRELLQLLPL